MHARVAAKRKKRVTERVVWIISVFDTPHEIMAYDRKTMSRLQKMFCTARSKAPCQIIVREVLDKLELSRSQLTLDEHKGQHQGSV